MFADDVILVNIEKNLKKLKQTVEIFIYTINLWLNEKQSSIKPLDSTKYPFSQLYINK